MENETFTKWALSKIDAQQAEIAKLKAEIAKQNQALYLIAKETTVTCSEYLGCVKMEMPTIYDNKNKHDNDFELVAEALGIFDLVFEARAELAKAKEAFDKAVKENENE